MPTQTIEFRVRHLRTSEIESLLRLCKAEGRHMGTVSEVQTWMHVDPYAFFVAVTTDGQIIGSCCGMRLSLSHGYVGMYVVDKDFRGLGVGQQVWNAAQAHLGARNKGLSAVAHLFTLYRDKAGFGEVADWTVDLYKLHDVSTILHRYKQQQLIVRRQTRRFSLAAKNDTNECQNESLCRVCIGSYEKETKIYCLAPDSKPGKGRKRIKSHNVSIENLTDDESFGFSNLFFEEQSNDEFSDLDEDSLDAYTKTEESNKSDENTGSGCKRLKPISYCRDGKLRTIHLNGVESRYMTEEIVEYDRKLHSYDRSKIVRATLAESNCLVRVALLGRTVVGYGCVKPNLQNMWIISPLYADNEYIAKLLLMDLVTDIVIYQKYNPNENFDSAIVLKTPSNNRHARKLLEKMDFVKQDYVLRRCYTKQVFETPNQNIYALHTSVFCTE